MNEQVGFGSSATPMKTRLGIWVKSRHQLSAAGIYVVPFSIRQYHLLKHLLLICLQLVCTFFSIIDLPQSRSKIYYQEPTVAEAAGIQGTHLSILFTHHLLKKFCKFHWASHNTVCNNKQKPIKTNFCIFSKYILEIFKIAAI